MFIAYIFLFGSKSFGVSIICQSENNPVVLYALACAFSGCYKQDDNEHSRKLSFITKSRAGY